AISTGTSGARLSMPAARAARPPPRSKPSAPTGVLLADRVARTDDFAARRTDIPFFVSFCSFVITSFILFCFCVSDWREEMSSLQTDQIRFCVGLRNRHESSSQKFHAKCPPYLRVKPQLD